MLELSIRSWQKFAQFDFDLYIAGSKPNIPFEYIHKDLCFGEDNKFSDHDEHMKKLWADIGDYIHSDDDFILIDYLSFDEIKNVGEEITPLSERFLSGEFQYSKLILNSIKALDMSFLTEIHRPTFVTEISQMWTPEISMQPLICWSTASKENKSLVYEYKYSISPKYKKILHSSVSLRDKELFEFINNILEN